MLGLIKSRERRSMKKLTFRKLNQHGFDHVLVLVAFVAVFGVVGSYLLFQSHAATGQEELRSGMTSSGTLYCLNEAIGGAVTVTACNNNIGQRYGYNWGNGEIELNAGCVAVNGAGPNGGFSQAAVHVTPSAASNVACSSVPWGSIWTPVSIGTNEYRFENNHADSKKGNGTWCLTAS